MSNGAIIFAQNSNTIDYTKLAVFAAERVQKYLDLPVSLITDNVEYVKLNYANHPFDKIIEITPDPIKQQKKFYDGTLSYKTGEWKNFSRSLIYDLTPYDRTLVLDSDYIINSSILKSAFYNDYDFQIYQNSLDIVPHRRTEEFNRINSYSIPFYWATVFVFKKNAIMESFFNLVEYIKKNWVYFRTLYNILNPVYRNDFAFSIAINIMNGKGDGDFAMPLSGKMIYCLDQDILIDVKDNKMKFLVEKENHLGEYTLIKTTGLDMHVINKFSLSRLIDGGSGV
jgi:hypothetical protein